MMRILFLLLLLASTGFAQVTANGPVSLDAFDASGHVLASTSFSVNVPSTNCLPCPICPACTNTTLQADSNMRTGTVTQSSIQFLWDVPSQPANNQLVVFNTGTVAILPGTANSYTLTGLPPSTTITAYVTAVTFDIFGAFTSANPVTPTGLQPPTSLTTTSAAPGSLTVNWNCLGSPAGFWLIINGSMTGWSTTTLTPTSYTSTITGLAAGTNRVMVDSHDASGTHWTNSVQVIGMVK